MAEEANLQQQYLDYAPRPFSPADKSNICYRASLDRLGFKPYDDPIAEETRLQFIRDLRAHVSVTEIKFLREQDNPPAFSALIAKFLQKHGPTYWGLTNRSHLAELNPLKGFLYPRDTNRRPSRLISVLEELFNYKAQGCRYNDSRKTQDCQILPHIDLAALTPSAINSIRMAEPGVSIPGVLREFEKDLFEESRCLSDSDDDPLPMRVRSSRSRKRDPRQSLSVPEMLKAMNTVVTDGLDKETKSAPAHNKKSKMIHNSSQANNLQAIENGAKRSKVDRGIMDISSPDLALSIAACAAQMAMLTESKSGVPSMIQKLFGTAVDYGNDDENTLATLDELPFANMTPSTSRTSLGSPSPNDQIPNAGLNVSTNHLSDETRNRISLKVIATNQQDMAPVTVRLSSYDGSINFFDFLASECELGDMSKNVKAVSATYTWDDSKHRLRRGRLDTDWAAFCDKLRMDFETNSNFVTRGCEVMMLLHVVS